MKMKLTTLLFGLLLAVGWTSSASAQALPEARADEHIVCLDGGRLHSAEMVKTQPGKTEVSQRAKSIRLNAPKRAFNPTPRTMVTLTKEQADALTYSYRDINGVLHENVPSTEVATDPCQMYSLLRFIYKTKAFPGPYTSAYTADGVEERVVYYGGIAGGWNIDGPTGGLVSDLYKPTNEGYTALIVSVKNTTTLAPKSYTNYDQTNFNSIFTDSTQIVNYFNNNVEFIKLLTDGVRITDAGGNPGTVYNCDGTYNKFFFLGKGQARQKDSEVISLQNTYGLMGERAPFKEMYEEFSPTGGLEGDQITDFYDKMREGNVYDVVHDCASVIDNGHQFSMAGNTEEKYYPLTGLNFFIPDYRLAYWVDDAYYIRYTDGYNHGPFTVDGRTMNPYLTTSGSRITGRNGRPINVPSYCANYAQYNPEYAPKVGIYKITLSATATFVGDPVNPDHSEDNLNYVVTLVWTSSLNDMAGYEVPQTYTIYCFDNVTGERFQLEATGVTNPTGQTTVSYLVPQRAHSYTIEYIVQGSPNDTEHPSFVAWSNRDFVVIPGWDDFVGLKLDHHESDFATNEMANYYRNFLEVVNEDLFGGLTVDKIVGKKNDQGEWVEKPMNEFTLYRFLYKQGENNDLVPVNNGTPIAKLTFGTPDDDGNVPYTVTYLNTQEQLETPKYDLDESHLNIPLTGVVRVKGNGDIVIWPNTYQVNFKSIKVYNGTDLVASWDVETMTTLPSSWKLSPGSEWEEYNHNGDQVGYIEGGGYIYIPGIVTEENSADLRVEIVAYGDLGTVSRIIVNDHTKTLQNGVANTDTYIWGGTEAGATPVSPYAAPKHDMDNNNNSNN
jgi:hypothetical protein